MTFVIYSLLFSSILAFLSLVSIKKEQVLIYLIVFNVFFDVVGYLDESVGETAIIRASITYLIFIYYLYKRGFSIYIVSVFPVLFVFYTTLIIPLSDDLGKTIRVHLRVISYVIYMVLMYDLFRSKGISVKQIVDKFPIILFIYILYTFAANIFDLGNLYRNRSGVDLINTGDIVGDFLLQISLVFVLLPLYFFYNKNNTKKWLFLLLCSISLVFVFASGRRTAILVMIIGYLVFLFFYRNKSTGLKYLILLVLFGGISVSFFIGDIITRFESRNRGLSTEVIEQEARTREIPVAFDLVMSFEEPIHSLLGKDMYADYGLVPGAGVRRPLHTDYARVLYGMGIFGFVIYFGFLFNTFFQCYKSRNYYLTEDKDKLLYSTLMMLIIFKLSVTYTGGLHVISYNSLLFGLIGALLGYMKNSQYSGDQKYLSKDL